MWDSLVLIMSLLSLIYFAVVYLRCKVEADRT